MSNHKHHIIPTYKCIELGLTTSYKVDGIEFYFKENMVEVTREQHALIHWGYKCNDLKPLLEVCNPPQHVMDMIPLGDNRDGWAAQYIALGEIEQIDTSGENSPRWIDGRQCNDPVAYMKKWAQTPKWKAYMKSYDKKRNATLERKAHLKEYQLKPEYKAYQKSYRQTPEYKAYQEYKQTPKYKAYKKEYDKKYYARKKAETQGVGTLKGFI